MYDPKFVEQTFERFVTLGYFIFGSAFIDEASRDPGPENEDDNLFALKVEDFNLHADGAHARDIYSHFVAYYYEGEYTVASDSTVYAVASLIGLTWVLRNSLVEYYALTERFGPKLELTIAEALQEIYNEQDDLLSFFATVVVREMFSHKPKDHRLED